MATSVTIEILKGIRDEVKQTNIRVDGLRDDLRDEMRGLREELSRRIVESEVRTSPAITELAGAVHEMTGVLRGASELRPRVERCEDDIATLKRRLP